MGGASLQADMERPGQAALGVSFLHSKAVWSAFLGRDSSTREPGVYGCDLLSEFLRPVRFLDGKAVSLRTGQRASCCFDF